jgi:hypothetical protein
MAGLDLASSARPGAYVVARGRSAPAFFGLHPFIDAHPEAVFIRETRVPSEDDSMRKRREALELARRIFALRKTAGIELSQKFALKPNLTATKNSGLPYAEPFAYPTEPVSTCLSGGERPGIRVIGEANSATDTPSLVVEYSVPAEGPALLEVRETFGDRVSVWAEGWTRRGVHAAEWDSAQAPSGTYFCRLFTHGVEQAARVTLTG